MRICTTYDYIHCRELVHVHNTLQDVISSTEEGNKGGTCRNLGAVDKEQKQRNPNVCYFAFWLGTGRKEQKKELFCYCFILLSNPIPKNAF